MKLIRVVLTVLALVATGITATFVVAPSAAIAGTQDGGG